MMKYEDPKLKIMHFDIADILTASSGDGNNYEELPEDNFGDGD